MCGMRGKISRSTLVVASPAAQFDPVRTLHGAIMSKVLRAGVWLLVAVGAAGAFARLALSRGETISAAWLLTAAVCSYAIAYRFYSKIIAANVFALDPKRATPAVRLDDGRDFVPTNRWIVFGHHFAAIAGPGPLVGPTLAAQFGYLPGIIWIVVGVALGGAVQDFVILAASVRRNGKSLGQMAREEIGPVAGMTALVAILGIMIVLLAVLALVVVNALKSSPWGIVTIGLTIPIAMLMGCICAGFVRPRARGERHRHRPDHRGALRRPLGRRATDLAPMFTLSGISVRSRDGLQLHARRCCRCGSCSRHATTSRRSSRSVSCSRWRSAS
jgi:hypothetical protein